MRASRLTRASRLAPLVLLAALGALGLFAAHSEAQRSLVIEDFRSEILVQRNADLLVTETLRPRFTGEWNGLFREVSLRHTTSAGAPQRLDVDVLSVMENGRPLRYEVETVDQWTRRYKIWVPGAENRTAEVEIRYRVSGAIRYFAADTAASQAPAAGGDYDELFWQVTGTNSEVPIQRASATVTLPPGAAALQAAAYFGSRSSTDQVEARLAAGGAVVPPVGPIRPGQGLTVAVGFEPGVVAQPRNVTRSPPVQLNQVAPSTAGEPMGRPNPLAFLPLLLPFLVFWFSHKTWEKRGRDPKGRAITVHWEPPEGLSSGEAGTLVDHRPDMHDVISILVDLAVRGYVEIEEREGGFLGFGKDYAFHLTRPRSEWGELATHEIRFLDGLFKFSSSNVLAGLGGGGGFLGGLVGAMAGSSATEGAPDHAVDSVLLSDLKNKFYKELPSIRNALLDSMVEKGYYRRRPDRVRGMWLAMAGSAAVMGALGMFAGSATGAVAGAATGLTIAGSMMAAGVASGLILAIFAFIMPARTETGARTREATLGFKQFLERVESPRYRRMVTSPEQFERYLPFAMAFRCEKKWAAAFDDLLTEPPDWYHGRHGTFTPSIFAADLGGMATTASSAMSTAPGSSSGSGGGGSVGGGSGGGGVGGF